MSMKLRNTTLATMTRLGFKASAEPQVRRNPYTGKQHTLVPEAVMLYDFITTRATCDVDYTRAEWDNARYYFASKWSDEYFDLLD